MKPLICYITKIKLMFTLGVTGIRAHIHSHTFIDNFQHNQKRTRTRTSFWSMMIRLRKAKKQPVQLEASCWGLHWAISANTTAGCHVLNRITRFSPHFAYICMDVPLPPLPPLHVPKLSSRCPSLQIRLELKLFQKSRKHYIRIHMYTHVPMIVG